MKQHYRAHTYILLFMLAILSIHVQAQIVITGKVSDAKTGEPLPYVSVTAKGTTQGTRTNFDGIYKLVLNARVDSIQSGYIGYKKSSKAVSTSASQVINMQLFPTATALSEVVIRPGNYVNPAWEILREVIKNKSKNDYRSLSSFQYQSYNRIELDATKFDEKLKQKKLIKSLLPLMDSLKKVAGEGELILPLFVSESISDYFYQQSPEKKRENILRTQINGIGFEDGALMSQLAGSTFQQHNFYKNYLSLAGKDFVSPIAGTWRLSYDYELEERHAQINGRSCFKISFKPKRPQDLAFTGTMWIAHDSYALCQIVATVVPSANLNFIEQVRIQQESAPTAPGAPWIPIKTRILLNVSQLTKGTAGFLAKFYTSNKNVQINKVYEPHFFDETIVLNDDAELKDDNFWAQNRHDSLTVAEQHVFKMIDDVKKVPIVKNYITIIDLLLSGYYKTGDIALGPYIFTYANNNVEGNRVRLGFKTNLSFSNRLILGGFAAYGTKDNEVKYGASADYILSRKPWTQAGVSYSHDLNQVALLSDSYNYSRNILFTALSKFGTITNRRVFMEDMTNLYIRRDIFKNFTQTLTFSHWTFNPLYQFEYYDQTNGQLRQNFSTAELQLESKWSPGVHTLQSPKRNSPLTVKGEYSNPVFTFRYTHGFRGALGSDLTYDKFSLNVTQTLRMGILGRGKYSLTAGYIPSTVPYPILENHLGNGLFLYNQNSYNMMRFFEFMSDRYVGLQYSQHLEGLLFNSLPLIRDLKWRLVGTANVLYGDISRKNIELIPNNNALETRGLGGTPYVELGYGVENIFKFIRVDFIHRLTYLDNVTPSRGVPSKFGVKFSAQIRL